MFEHQATIYRDFDIRGKYGTEITDDEVYKIAKALSHYFLPKSVAIGYDIRPSGKPLCDVLTRGFVEEGVDVVHLDLCTTPMSYFMCGSTDVDMVIMVTASHMPSEYNGLKITVEDAKPVTKDILQEIRKIVGTHSFSSEGTRGSISSHALQKQWIDQFKARHNLSGTDFSIVIDPANMIGLLEIDTFKAFPELTVHTIFDTPDHTCPNHEANPIKSEALCHLQSEVLAKQTTLGIAFDGDADRVGFVDETGTTIRSDVIGALLARQLLTKHGPAPIVCDVRTSRSVKEYIEQFGGIPLREKVGHTNIRTRMRKEDSLLGFELSGHFFFKESFYSEGGALPVFLILELMRETQQPLSALAREVVGYFHSGEINSSITRTPESIYGDVISSISHTVIDQLDGLTLEAQDWWCNIRPSANDPVLRLNVEAATHELLQEKIHQLLTIIRSEN